MKQEISARKPKLAAANLSVLENERQSTYALLRDALQKYGLSERLFTMSRPVVMSNLSSLDSNSGSQL